jgi:hypothetical protein
VIEHQGTQSTLKNYVVDVVFGLPESDSHLFLFLCPFAKTAWFFSSWFLRSESFLVNARSIAQVISLLLAMNHPESNL